MKSVYILTAISPKVAYDGKKGHYARDTKHNFICHAITVGVFNSIEAAEKTIKTLVADNAG